MKIILVLRSGFTFGVTCEKFSIIRNELGNYTGCEIKDIKDNEPLFIRWEDVVLVYRADMDREVTEWTKD